MASGSLNKAIKSATDYSDKKSRWTWVAIAIVSGVLASVIATRFFIPMNMVTLSEEQVSQMSIGLMLKQVYGTIDESQQKLLDEKINSDMGKYLDKQEEK